LFAEYLLKIT